MGGGEGRGCTPCRREGEEGGEEKDAPRHGLRMFREVSLKVPIHSLCTNVVHTSTINRP